MLSLIKELKTAKWWWFIPPFLPIFLWKFSGWCFEDTERPLMRELILMLVMYYNIISGIIIYAILK
jgi:hypothetical protein